MDTPVVEGVVLGGRYRLGTRLGGGGMADVYDGVDERLRRAVALKVLRPELAADPTCRRRFEAEARATARLSHPNVVAVFDSGHEGGRSYLVMERVAGETLAERIARGPVDQPWLKEMALDVLGALAAAHAAGILHRDIKPANILITPGGRAKLSDFGIAKAVDPVSACSDAGVDPTATGLVIGTPFYLAPERLQGRPATPQSDLYSVGIVLYEALTGRKPSVADPDLPVAPASRGAWPPDARRFRPDADPVLIHVVTRALDPDPAARFPSAADMARALYDTGPAPTARLPAAAWPATTAATARRRRRRWPAALVGAALLAALLIATLVLSAHGRSGPSAERNANASSTTAAAPAPSSPAASSPGASSPAATAVTQPADPVASELRTLARRLTPADGPAATRLAAGLNRIADQPPEQRPQGGSTLLADAASWYQHGQLSPTAFAQTVTALTDAGAQPSPPPSAPSPPPAKEHKHGEGGGD
jgi:serine/threonine protein kinase